jgi:hypothetical protein
MKNMDRRLQSGLRVPERKEVPHSYSPSISKPHGRIVAVKKESEGSPTPAVESEESEPAILDRNDFVLLNDEIKHWIVRIEDISLLEAHQNFTIAQRQNSHPALYRGL